MLAGLLMMAGFVGMIMLNLSHAHSELDSLQGVVEMQSRELKMLGQANGQMALEVRSKLAILDNLTLKSDQQQATQDQLLQELSTLSTVQQKLGAEMEKFEPRIEEMKQKAGAEEQEIDGVGEEMVDLKEELKQLKLEVSSLSAALERLAVAPAAPADPAAHHSPDAPAMSEGAALKGTDRGNEAESEEPKETGVVEPEETEQESPESEAPPPGEAELAEGLVEAEKSKESENSAEPRPRRPSSETSGAPSPGLKLAGAPGPKVGSPPPELPPVSAANSSEISQEAAFLQISDAFHHSAAKMPQEVRWFKECGCTGIEIEAVMMLRGLVARLGADRVKTNKCEQSCSWPAQVHEVLKQIEVQEEHLFPSGSREVNPGSPPTVLVIHAAFLGVCGVNARLEQAVQGPAGRKGLVLVSRSMVEVDTLDAEASRDCNGFDYVWVPSAQSREAFLESGLSKDRVKVLPEAVDTSVFSCSSAKVQPAFRSGAQALDDFLGRKPKQSFTFLSIFKWEPRKNWHGLLESFLDAFPEQYTSIRGPNGESRNVSVRLLVKTQILHWSPDDPRQDVPDLLRQKGLSEASLEGQLLVFHDFLNSGEIPKLFKAVDGFILPTHGEGWGLPLIEAMASGIPTISTGWGGQMDFMSKENSWPVSYDLVESQNFGARWAQPRKEALMEAMREVVFGGARVRSKLERGCDLVHQKYHIDAVANQAVDLMMASLEALHRS